MSAKIKQAIEDIKAGKPVVMVDNYERENEGDLVIATEKATKENIVFTMNKARGLMCIPCHGSILDDLNLPAMVPENEDPHETPFTVSADAVGTTTGMSVTDKLKTMAVFADPNSKPEELTRPGHLFPLRAKDGLLSERKGHTEGAVELVKLAGLRLSAVICEIVNDDGSMANGDQIPHYAEENQLTLISVDELYDYVYNRG